MDKTANAILIFLLACFLLTVGSCTIKVIMEVINV